jgi:hypothetical protein
MKLVLPIALPYNGALIAGGQLLKDPAHGCASQLHRELQEVLLGEKQVATISDLQPVGRLEVFQDLRYQRINHQQPDFAPCADLDKLRILPFLIL